MVKDVNASVGSVEIEGFRDAKYFTDMEYSVINLGSVEDDMVRNVTIYFSSDTKISMDNIYVCAYDFSDYEEYIENLKADTVGRIDVSTNQVQINVSFAENKIQCLAVPYGKGWSAYIDGERAAIYKINNVFMGMEIPEGEHSIVFKYQTEGIRMGIFISLASVIVLIVLVWHNRKKKSEAI